MISDGSFWFLATLTKCKSIYNSIRISKYCVFWFSDDDRLVEWIINNIYNVWDKHWKRKFGWPTKPSSVTTFKPPPFQPFMSFLTPAPHFGEKWYDDRTHQLQSHQRINPNSFCPTYHNRFASIEPGVSAFSHSTLNIPAGIAHFHVASVVKYLTCLIVEHGFGNILHKRQQGKEAYSTRTQTDSKELRAAEPEPTTPINR